MAIRRCPNAQLDGAIIRNADLVHSFLTEEQLYTTASYKENDLTGVRLGGNVSGWDFRGQQLPNATFWQGGNLTCADFTNANLEHASLVGTDLTGASFVNANLDGASLLGTVGFSPDITTSTRNMIWPDGTVRGLHVDTGEVFAMPSILSDHFIVESGGTIEITMIKIEGFGATPPRDYNHRVADGTEVRLDGSVDFADFLNLSASFGAAGGWVDGDFDGDGVVQFPDFLILSGNFGQKSETFAVPEPAGMSFTLVILVFSKASNNRQRRKSTATKAARGRD